jgi:predicted DNA-binding transcriptional regulator YafY
MMQFAFYDKETRPDEGGTGYRCRIHYDKRDETELLIRVLSFGPVVRVLGPQPFVAQVRRRVENQFACMEG